MMTLKERTYNHGQAWYYEHTWRDGKYVLRTEIRRGNSLEQSHGKVSIWTDAGWKTVVYVPGASTFDHEVLGLSYTARKAAPAIFSATALGLEEEAREIVGLEA